MANEEKTGPYALVQNGQALKEGEFHECWEYLVKEFSNSTLQEIVESGIKIGKI